MARFWGDGGVSARKIKAARRGGEPEGDVVVLHVLARDAHSEVLSFKNTRPPLHTSGRTVKTGGRAGQAQA